MSWQEQVREGGPTPEHLVTQTTETTPESELAVLATEGLLGCAPHASAAPIRVRRLFDGLAEPGATSAMTRLLGERGAADPCSSDASRAGAPSASLRTWGTAPYTSKSV